jgi:hypothetical protein
MSKHTPGPWGLEIELVYDSADRLIADCSGSARFDDDTVRANAHLIAAAPEMLEVMERALKLSREHADFKLYAMEPFERAIAKAKGESK